MNDVEHTIGNTRLERETSHREGDFPASEEASECVAALPMFPEITEAQQQRVVEVCATYLRQAVRRAA